MYLELVEMTNWNCLNIQLSFEYSVSFDSLTAALTKNDMSLVRYGHVTLEFGGEYARHLVRSDCQLKLTTRENNFHFLSCLDRRKKMVRI